MNLVTKIGTVLQSRILLITAHYQPEPNFVTADLAQSLAQSGDIVTVITAHPNYPYGRFYPSVKSIWQKQSFENGVRIWRLPFFPDHSMSKVRRALSFLSFAFIAAVWAPFVSPRPRIVIVYQTPFTTALAALWYKWVMRSKVVFVSCDLWPESFSATGVVSSGLVMRMAYSYSRWINRQADLIVCSTNGMVSRYKSDGIPEHKLKFAPAWTDGLPKLGESILIDSIAKQNSKRVVYAGNLGTAQGLAVFVEAARICAVTAPEISFHIYGTGTDHRVLEDRAAGLTNITFHGRVLPEAAFRAMQEAMAVLVHLVDTPLFRMTLPSKLGSAFAAGGIVLAGLKGEGETVVNDSRAGFTFEPESAEQLVDAILHTKNMPPHEYALRVQKGIEFYERNFEKSRLCDQYCEWIKALVNPASATQPG
jgi:glycosyltransferase involved in cell wall biosynthesis